MSAPNPLTPPRDAPENPDVPAPRDGKRPLIAPEDVSNIGGEDASSDESSNNSTVRQQLNVGEGSGASAADEGGSYVCPECGKTFAKRKALHGHMRCHPDRNWRGVTLQLRQRPRLPSGAEKEVAASLIMLAGSGGNGSGSGEGVATGEAVEGEEGRFECSVCKKVFSSRQALGGHRASHKNVPGCYAMGKEEGESSNRGGGEGGGDEKNGAKEEGKEEEEKKEKVVEKEFKCEVCSRVFVNAQGLGAHRRVHAKEPRKGCLVDLNLPAPEEEEEDRDHSASKPKFDLNK